MKNIKNFFSEVKKMNKEDKGVFTLFTLFIVISTVFAVLSIVFAFHSWDANIALLEAGRANEQRYMPGIIGFIGFIGFALTAIYLVDRLLKWVVDYSFIDNFGKL